MGNTVPPREATGRRGAGTGRRRSENVVVTEAAAPPATPSPVAATARKQGRAGDDDVEGEETTTRAGRGLLRAGVGDGAAPAGKALTVKMVMRRKDAEALAARLEAQSARERKARMAELRSELQAGSCGGASRDAWRPMLPPVKEKCRFERTPVV